MEAEQKTLEQQYQAQLNDMKARQESAHKDAELATEQWKAKLQAETSVMVARIGAGAKVDANGADAPDMNVALTAALDGFTQAIQQLAKPRVLIRGPDGRAVGLQ